jgi:hypothetical protein
MMRRMRSEVDTPSVLLVSLNLPSCFTKPYTSSADRAGEQHQGQGG